MELERGELKLVEARQHLCKKETGDRCEDAVARGSEGGPV